MFVMTVDQRRSRKDVDRVERFLTEFADQRLIRPFERTAGDEVQSVTDDAEAVVDIALRLVADGRPNKLIADELGIARPAPTGVQTPTGRRMRNARLRAAGVELRYPTYREGYREMLRAEG